MYFHTPTLARRASTSISVTQLSLLERRMKSLSPRLGGLCLALGKQQDLGDGPKWRINCWKSTDPSCWVNKEDHNLRTSPRVTSGWSSNLSRARGRMANKDRGINDRKRERERKVGFVNVNYTPQILRRMQTLYPLKPSTPHRPPHTVFIQAAFKLKLGNQQHRSNSFSYTNTQTQCHA